MRFSGEDIDRLSRAVYATPLGNHSQNPVEEFRRKIPPLANTARAKLGADAVVLSVSASAGNVAGVGAGFELLCFASFGWATYGQIGAGVSTPGGQIIYAGGLVWNVETPQDYRGPFDEFAVSVGRGVVGAASFFTTPPEHGAIMWTTSPTLTMIAELLSTGFSEACGFKAGWGSGTGSGASFLWENYWLLSRSVPRLPRPGRGGHTANMAGMSSRERRRLAALGRR